MAAEYYHASHDPLEPGTVLTGSRFELNPFQWDVVRNAVLVEPEPRNRAVIKALLLADVMIGRGKTQTLPFVLKEVIFEFVRNRDFAHLPSRLQSTFLSPSLEDARRFREMARTPEYDRPYLYACSLSGGVSPFRADLSHVATVNPLANIDEQLKTLIERAISYWQGQEADDPCWELLVPVGAVRITAHAQW